MDWAPYLTGGAAARPDSISGMTPDFQSALSAMFAGAPEEIRSQLQIKSGFRSPELQAKLWDDALKKYGSPEAARKWVAPPGKSQHGHGNAGDLGYLSPAAREWAHQNAAKYGLSFPLANEDWHIELASARGGHAPHDSTSYAGRGAAQSSQASNPTDRNPLRLAWAYANGKMNPQDAAIYERGMAEGVFPQAGGQSQPNQPPQMPNPLDTYRRVAMGQQSQAPMMQLQAQPAINATPLQRFPGL